MYIVGAAETISAEKLDARDEDCRVVGGRGGLQKIGCNVELIVVGEKDAGFMEEGIFGCCRC